MIFRQQTTNPHKKYAISDTMKIRVQHEDGRIETVTIQGKLEVSEGRELDRIRTENGMEFFFTKTGYYDGWGGNISESQQSSDIIKEVESRRDIEGVKQSDRSTIQ